MLKKLIKHTIATFIAILVIWIVFRVSGYIFDTYLPKEPITTQETISSDELGFDKTRVPFPDTAYTARWHNPSSFIGQVKDVFRDVSQNVTNWFNYWF